MASNNRALVQKKGMVFIMLKKRVITYGIAAAMVLSSSFSAFAQGPGGMQGGPGENMEMHGAPEMNQDSDDNNQPPAPPQDNGQNQDNGDNNQPPAPPQDNGQNQDNGNSNQPPAPPQDNGQSQDNSNSNQPPAPPQDNEQNQDNDGSNQPPAPPQDNEQNQDNGDNNQPPAPPQDNGQSQDNSNNNLPPVPPQGDFQDNNRPEKSESFDIVSLFEERTSEITDEETLSNINTLIETFKEALDAEKALLDSENIKNSDLDDARKAVSIAREALITAIKAAGIDVSDLELPNDRGPRDMNRARNGEISKATV